MESIDNHLLLNPHASADSPLRIGLIGVTGYARAYYDEINKLVDRGLVEWGAVTIINREEAPEQVAFFESSGIPIFGDYQEMLEAGRGKLNWICVPTAISWHKRMTVDALSLGYPVLLEKPIAPTLQDVQAIQEAERKAGKPVLIGFQHTYCESTWEIKKRLLDGVIGNIERIESICLWPRSHSYYTRNNWGGKLFVDNSWVLDSPLHNALSHVLNLVLFFGGASLESRADPTHVSAELYRSKPIQSYDTVRTEALLDTGIKSAVILSHGTESSIDPEIYITGSRGSLRWRFTGEHVFEINGDRQTIKSEDPLQVREIMFDNIQRKLRNDPTAHVCTTEQAKGEVKWVNAVHDATPIHEIPENLRRTVTGADGELYDQVEGLDVYARKAYAEGCWFKDAGAPWAVEPGHLDLQDYKAFQARNIPAPAPAV